VHPKKIYIHKSSSNNNNNNISSCFLCSLGPINREMRNLISSLKNHNEQLKVEVQRYKRRLREAAAEITKVLWCHVTNSTAELFRHCVTTLGSLYVGYYDDKLVSVLLLLLLLLLISYLLSAVLQAGTASLYRVHKNGIKIELWGIIVTVKTISLVFFSSCSIIVISTTYCSDMLVQSLGCRSCSC